MWWAFIISGLIHLCFVYLLPTIDFLPADSKYIELDETWLATLPDEGIATDVADGGEEPVDTGIEPASSPDMSNVWSPPPTTEVLEPVSVAERSTDNAWETAFIGQDPDNPATFEQPERERAIAMPLEDHVIPPRTLKDLAIRPLSKTLPEESERPVSEPEIRPETEAEIQAEQRFQESLFSNTARPLPEILDPERLPANLPDTVEVDQEVLPGVTAMTREALAQPERLLAADSVLPSAVHDKSLPSVIVPEMPERSPIENEDIIAATEPVVNISEIAVQRVRRDPADELPEPEISPQEMLIAQPAILPEIQPQEPRVDIPPRPQTDFETMTPVSFAAPRPVSEDASNKLRMTSLSDNSRKEELTLNDSEMQAFQPTLRQNSSQISEEAAPPADTPRLIMPKALTIPEQVEQIPARRKLALSRTQRSLILGVNAQVPTLPFDAPRFGIAVSKKDVNPEEALLPDTDLHPDDSLQQAAQEPAQRTDEFVIEGPAATRQVLFKPPRFPDIELDVDVTIRLKFWVLPDGTVGEVLPLQRGDVRLERAAIAYMKNWRFTPVSPDQPQIWGIIPITYTLR